MAFYLPKLWADIRDRLLSDTGEGGLRNADAPLVAAADITNIFARAGGGYPSIVYNVASATQTDAFRTATREVTFDVHVLVEEQPDDGGDPADIGAKILARIAGDWTAQPAGTGPTYGLDRWQPPLSGTGWSASIVEAVDSREEHAEGMYHWVETFRVLVSKAGA